jgi:hypothetical protein
MIGDRRPADPSMELEYYLPQAFDANFQPLQGWLHK